MIRCNVFVLLHYYNFEEKIQALFLGIVKNDYLCTRNMNVCSSLEDELIKE